MICSELDTMAEDGNDNDDFKDNLRNSRSTGENQYPDEFEVYFTDHRKTVPGRDKRPSSRVSSSSSTKSKDGQTKRTKFGSLEEAEDEDFIDSKEDMCSEEEFQVTFKNTLEWEKRMIAFLKSSVNMIKQTSMSLKTELSVVKNQVAEVRKENRDKIDQIERSVAHVSGIFKSWKEEKAVLISQITELKAEYELKFDEIEQYSRRSCLIMTGLKESQEDSTDKTVLDIFLNNLGVRLDLSEVDRSHRLGPKKTDQDGNVSNRPIIIKFITYWSRQKEKKKKETERFGLFYF